MERVGDTRTRKVDVRLVAATNEDLDEAVREGRFRADLLYRLNVYTVTVPPLRERMDDVPELVTHFVEKYSSLHGKQVRPPTDRAMALLRTHPWPGNIRELANMIERGVILADQGGSIEAEHLFPHARGEASTAVKQAQDAAPAALADLVEGLLDDGCQLAELEQAMLEAAVARAGGNVTRAASLLGMSRATLDYRLKKTAGR